MDIAIIGAGNVGTALATAATRAGHRVIIASRDPQDASELAATTGAHIAATNSEAVRDADIVVLAVPASSLADIAGEIAEPARGKPVVDVSNRMTFDESGPGTDTTSSNAEDLAAKLPDAHVVKAFNTLFASNQADPTVEGVQLDGYVAGDDPAAKAAVLRFVESIGLHPVDVGSLVRSRQLEALGFLNILLNMANGGSWQSGWKLVGAPETVPVSA